MKQITIAGRLGRDAELRRTGGGDAVLNFTVAVDEGRGENKKTLWFRCAMWGKRGEALERYLVKGAAVTVAGDLSTEEYEGKTNLTVRANELTLQGGRSNSDEDKQERAPAPSRPAARAATRPLREELDDEIPFLCEWR